MRDGPGILRRKPGDVIMPIQPVDQTDLDPVIKWRYECLHNAGFPPDQAFLLAEDRSVDLHRACRACRLAGPERAWEIFS